MNLTFFFGVFFGFFEFLEPKQAKTLTRGEFYKFLDGKSPEERLDVIKACITLVFVFTAARCKELWTLRGGDVVVKRDGYVFIHLRDRKNYSMRF